MDVLGTGGPFSCVSIMIDRRPVQRQLRGPPQADPHSVQRDLRLSAQSILDPRRSEGWYYPVQRSPRSRRCANGSGSLGDCPTAPLGYQSRDPFRHLLRRVVDPVTIPSRPVIEGNDVVRLADGGPDRCPESRTVLD